MIKKIYNIDDIVKIGSDTDTAVSETVNLIKEYVGMLVCQGVNGMIIGLKLNEVCNDAGSDMSTRTFFALTTDSTDEKSNIEIEFREYNQLIEGNQHKLKAVNRYIVEKAFSPLGAGESRKIRELLSEEWAHAYVSLIAQKFNERICKTA